MSKIQREKRKRKEKEIIPIHGSYKDEILIGF